MYTNKARIQNYLLITIDDSFASQIDEWIEAAQNYIDNYTGITFEEESGVTYKIYDGDGSRELLIDELITFTKVEILDEDGDINYTIDSSDEYYLYPANKTPKTRIKINPYNAPISYFPEGDQNVKVYGTFGYASSVPEDIRLAATKLVAEIITESNFEVGKEIKSEKLGEYSISYQDVSDMAKNLGINNILDKYVKFEIAGV